ncbi:bifunctional precorrin-2 dehydrogenase/sirohydrochlorin ferrochelatase [Paenibacillus sp. WLX2291]|uniref:precorrin-2 dehydrogenase/sirohydrochlorin ferrochelatase family protein n=1 Tax=Paenibacillus sp. WLX2291 TaxID=3296934 RepID=UPI003983F21D
MSERQEPIPYLPVLLDCRGQQVLVVGGGMVAERKILHLLEAGAQITLISPEVTAGLQQLAEERRLIWHARGYTHGDVDAQRYWLIHAASSQQHVNEQVAQAAKRYSIPVNVAHRQEEGNFINPAVIRRGGLVASISTSGAGPAVSRRIVQELEAHFGQEYETYIAFLHYLRHRIQAEVNDAAERKLLLERASALDILAQIRHKQFVWWDDEQTKQWIRHNRGEVM